MPATISEPLILEPPADFEARVAMKAPAFIVEGAESTT